MPLLTPEHLSKVIYRGFVQTFIQNGKPSTQATVEGEKTVLDHLGIS